MILFPKLKVSDIPNGQRGLSDVSNVDTLIDVSSSFLIRELNGIKKSWYTGLTARMFDAQLKFGFNDQYTICDLEFQRPFDIGGEHSLFYMDIDLFQPTLLAAKTLLEEAGINIKLTDVGFEAAEIGVSFFSDEYETDLNVRLDAVTVHFNRPE